MPEAPTISVITQIVCKAIPLTGDATEVNSAIKRRVLLKLLIENLLKAPEEITTNGVEEVCKKGIPLTTCQIKERHNVKTRQWLKEVVLKLADGTKHLRGVAEDANRAAF